MATFTAPRRTWAGRAALTAMLLNKAGAILFIAGTILLSTTAPAAAAEPPAGAATTQPDLKPLIDKIATGTADEAAAAVDELVRQVTEPVAAALKGLEQRPPAEQRRLLEALGRAGAVLRARLYRAELPAEDAQLFDEFMARDHELVEKLFDDDPRRRLAALYQVPLEPGTAAGALITAKLFDWDAFVVEAAMKTAARLTDDPVTVRGLTRFVQAATQLVCSSGAGLLSEEGAAWVEFTRKAIGLLGQARAKSSVPVIVAAVRCFGRPPQRGLFYVAEAFEALGKIGDEAAVPLLLECTEDREQQAVRNLGPGKLLKVTVGDAALLALVRIYGLSPEELGFVSTSGGEVATGFLDDAARRNALRAFALWHKENGGKSPQERAPLSIQREEPSEPTKGAPSEQP